jgi:hypothetical protein
MAIKPTFGHRESAGSRQAAGVSRQDAFRAALHRKFLRLELYPKTGLFVT